MLHLDGVALDAFFLPDDSIEAEPAFLALLHQPAENYGAFYGFTLSELLAEIEACDRAGIPGHYLLDRSQFEGATEKKEMPSFLAALRCSDVTITTAGPRSDKPSEIMHRKTLITAALDGGAWHVWEGSVNLSRSGWEQANCALTFRSDEYAARFIGWFIETRAWARQHIKQPGG